MLRSIAALDSGQVIQKESNMTATAKIEMMFLDETSETSRVQAYLEDTISAVSQWVALFTGTGPYVTLRNAIEGVTDCSLQKSQSTFVIETPANAVPSTTSAQREAVLRLTLADAVNGKKFTLSIPGPKPSMRTAGTDAASFAAGAMQTLKNAIEDNCFSGYGNAVLVVSGRFTGRNN